MKKTAKNTRRPPAAAPAPWVAWGNRHVWLLGVDLDTELLQAEQEGRDLRPVRALVRRLSAAAKPEAGILGGARGDRWLADYALLSDRIQSLPLRADYTYREPNDLEAIRRLRPEGPALAPWRGSRAAFRARLHGGLLGRICGCLLGKPVEGWRRESIRATAEATGNWPLTGYLRLPTRAEDRRIAAREPRNRFDLSKPGVRAHPCLLPNIDGMVEDDDTNYTATGFAIVKRWGAAFTPADVGTFWMQDIPILHTCTAERVAYRNLARGIPPPQSALVRNPYREWIGAQIRADYFGYANPGRPERAAEWAWRDASISHVRNGIYGEMWVAAMLASAYVADDWPTIIRAGLAQVPRRSRLREDVESVLELHAAGATYDDALTFLHRQWDESRGHDWCHTNSNAQIVAIGLLWDEGDFGTAIARAVMCGFDTDCNGATVGSLWGVRHGVRAIPSRWTAPVRNTLRTGVSGYHSVAIDALAAEMADVALKNA